MSKAIFKTYKELSRLSTFADRFEYLKLGGAVGESTFGFDRYLNQAFYRSREWQDARRSVIIRDNGCDLGIEGFPCGSRILIHHINPITIEDIEERNPDIFNPEYLICCSHNTHNAIHYGDESLIFSGLVERKPGDTCLWKGGAK